MLSYHERAEELDEKICSAENQRAELSVSAAAGDKTALRQIAQIDVQYEALINERRTLASALEQLQALKVEEQQSILAAADEKRHAEAAAHAASVVSLNEKIDTKLGELQGMFAARDDALRAIQRLHVVDHGYLSRLGKAATTAAMCAAGLSRYVEIRVPSPSGIKPLAASNSFLAGIGKKPKVDA
jgi:hypothetical protein